jgi:hypothetical protein
VTVVRPERADDAPAIRRVHEEAPFGEGRCAQAIGVSTREPLGHVPLAARAYVFTYQPWTMDTAAAAVRGVQR